METKWLKSLQRLAMLFAFVTLTGCQSVQPQQPPATSFTNEEKDNYISKVESIVSDSASALTAVVNSLPKGDVRELVQGQVIRLGGVSKPSTIKVEEYSRMLAQSDSKAIQKDKDEASKVDAETDVLYAMVEQRDLELAEANSRADAEFKQKILWQFSTAGLGLFIAGLLAFAFTPFKKSAGIVMAGGMLAMASAWIFDSTWFTWVVAVSVCVSVIGIAISIYKDKSNKASEQDANKEDKRKEAPVLSE
jgi:hypothetical protein